MAKKLFLSLTGLSLAMVLIVACEKDAKTDEKLPAPPVVSNSFVEEFDTVGNLSAKGWVIVNNSAPSGPMSWRQGKYELGGKLGNDIVGFPAYSAVYNQNEFASVDLNCGSDVATLSAWIITKEIIVKNGDVLSFYTRCNGDYADRLQVRANYTTTSTNVGSGPNEVGDFSTLLLDINPNLNLVDYPVSWTKYSITVSGVTGTVKARFGFRYFVTEGGPSGANSDMIGIDKLEFVSK
ncbi:MAG: choice-of-anchor J domain-containing protein [Chitinophagaceae bacterium]|uniref:choice-of-anchor J domain-containing protein n=1 Tax=unclassified Paraflavitalea TaxID=2798305 RepID=UPI003D32886B|nr:choice-of-anchor J domain-containing protein [Chitinophagaceae bacterium]